MDLKACSIIAWSGDERKGRGVVPVVQDMKGSLLWFT